MEMKILLAGTTGEYTGLGGEWIGSPILPCVTLSLRMAIESKPGAAPTRENLTSTPLEALSGVTFMIAMLQSLCTAVLTISGIRVAIGLSALAAAAGIYAPAHGFHKDAIRIPMLALAAVGAILNLAVLFWIRSLRARPAAQWRRRELTKKQKRSERLQIVLAIVTLLLVGLEVWTHPMVHRTGHKPVESQLHLTLSENFAASSKQKARTVWSEPSAFL
jgi:hypothetical protein